MFSKCRACLGASDDMQFVSALEPETQPFISMFTAVTNSEWSEGDKIPSYLCSICVARLQACYQFQKQCQESNEIIQIYLETEDGKSDDEDVKEEQGGSDGDAEEDEECQDLEEVPRNRGGPPTVRISQVPVEQVSRAIQEYKKKINRGGRCVECGAIMATLRALATHMAHTHKSRRGKWCYLCNKVFDDLPEHRVLHNHMVEDCRFCSKPIKRRYFIEHLRFHTGVRPFNCDLCSKAFLTLSNLKFHYRQHETAFECETCKKRFVTEALLEDHQCNPQTNSQLATLEDDKNTVLSRGLPHNFCKLCNKRVRSIANHNLKFHENPQEPGTDSCNSEALLDDNPQANGLTEVPKQLATPADDKNASLTRVLPHNFCLLCNKRVRSLANHKLKFHENPQNDNQAPEPERYDDGEALLECNPRSNGFVDKTSQLATPERDRDTVLRRALPHNFCKLCNKRVRSIANHNLKFHENPSCSDSQEPETYAERYETEVKSEEHQWSPRANGSVEAATQGDKNMVLRRVLPHNFCKICDKRVRSIVYHTLKFHENSPSDDQDSGMYCCSVCDRQYNKLKNLMLHMRLHTGPAPYKCSYCGKLNRTKAQRMDHERTHTGEKPFVCNVCGKAFAQSSALRTHMKQHTGRPEVCKLCQKRFCRPSELKLHLMKHAGEKPYLCTVCGKTFSQLSHLTEHSKRHSSQRPYKCDQCDKAFKHKSLLTSHVQIHLGYKPFKCSMCSYACYKAYRLGQHMKQHSGEVKETKRGHVCRVCQKGFTTQTLLNSHMSSTHNAIL